MAVAQHARDIIVQELAAVLAAVPSLAGKVYRSSGDVYAGQDAPCAAVGWTADQRDGEMIAPVQLRALSIEIALRARKSTDLDAELDALAANVEQAVALHTWSAPVKRVYIEGTVVAVDHLDRPIGAITQTWEILYRIDTRQPDQLAG